MKRAPRLSRRHLCGGPERRVLFLAEVSPSHTGRRG